MFNPPFTSSFGQPAAPASNPFGQTGTSFFGGSTAAPTSTPFGSTNPTPAFGSGTTFGNPAPPANPFGAPASTNPFANTTTTTATNPFGGAASTNLFGQPSNPFAGGAGATNNPFGAQTTTSTNPFASGAANNPFATPTSNNPFGQTTAATTTGFGTGFGPSTNPFGGNTSSNNPFATTTPAANTNPFATTAATQSTGSSFFGGTAPSFGTGTGLGLSNTPAPAFTFGTSATTGSSTTGSTPALSFGTTPSTPFSSSLGLFAPATPSTGQNTGFGLGTSTFGTSSSLFSTPSTGFGMPPPTSAPIPAPDNPVNTLLLLRDFFNPQSDKCRFRCYFYNLVENAHTLPKPPNFNDALWESAQRNNPDRTRLFPVQAVGYQDLNRRMETQRQETASHRKCLTILGQHIEKIEQKHNLEILPRVDLLKHTLEESNHRILKLVIRLEVLRRRGQMTTDEEEMILAQLEKLHRSLNHLTGLRQRVNDLFTLARSQSVDLTPTIILDPDMEAVIFEILEQQRKGLGELCSIVNHDNAQVDQLSALVSKK